MQPKIQKLLYSFFGKYKLRTFVKGEIIIRPGNNKILFLTKGVVRMFISLKGINNLTLNVYKAHAIFPMALILGVNGDKYRYAALTEAEGYFAPRKVFETFLRENPQVLLDLLKRIYRGLDGLFMQLQALLTGDAYFRIVTALIIYAKRFGKLNKDKITFDFHLTHYQLASQTGLARESVTKEIKILQDKGLVGYMGKKLFIYSLSKLEEEYNLYTQN